MKLLFIAPQGNLNTSAELSRIASGNTVDIVDGLLDRAGLERALRSGNNYDGLHFAGHGGKSVLQLSDGIIDAADFASMLDAQRDIKFAFVNACDSLAVGTAIHNALHVPIVAHDAEIKDTTAIRFAERFYREYRRTRNVGEAFEAARATLIRLFPGEAMIPTLINGDMATRDEIGDCMAYLKSELGGVFEHFNERLDTQDIAIAELGRSVRQIERRHTEGGNRTVLIIIGLLAANAFLQAVTPWLNSVFAK